MTSDADDQRDVADAVRGPRGRRARRECRAQPPGARRRGSRRGLVAAHGVDGDGQHRAMGTISGDVDGRRSADVDGDAVLVPTAGRAHRVRQLCVAAARAVLRAGAPRRHAPARWLRVFIFDFFFLGTATVGLHCARNDRGRASAEMLSFVASAANRLASSSWSERRPRASNGEPARGDAVARAGVEIDAADRAQTRRSRGRHSGDSGASSSASSRTIGARSSWSPTISNASGSVTTVWYSSSTARRPRARRARVRQRRHMPCQGTSISPRRRCRRSGSRGAVDAITVVGGRSARRRGRGRPS